MSAGDMGRAGLGAVEQCCCEFEPAKGTRSDESGFRSFTSLKRPCKFPMRLPYVKRREQTRVAKHRGPGTARAEPARDGVFCVFAKGVCSLKSALR